VNKTTEEEHKGKEKIVKLDLSNSVALSAKIFFLVIFILTAVLQPVIPQSGINAGQHSLRIVFYNVENFFDPYPDTTTSYNEFTPEGERHWTEKRFQLKRQHIYKVIAALGGWEPVAVMGFAEIENRLVIEDLIRKTPLKNDHYSIVHFESNDHRGIDVGAIYLSDRLKLLHAEPIHLKDKNDSVLRTRDILYMKFLLAGDTLHVFFNHWPSRYGGLLETQGLRHLASSVLKSFTDSICRVSLSPNILIMGDFNDDPDDESIRFLTDSAGECGLETLTPVPMYNHVKGTLKYQAGWNIFDQAIVSVALSKHSNGLGISSQEEMIFDAGFLLEKDEKNLGYKLNRTYAGFKYKGGYSDHLPVFVDIYSTNQ